MARATSVSREIDQKFLTRNTDLSFPLNYRFLKFEADLAINSEYATYDSQFGVVRRPTIRNTTWERAKFEGRGRFLFDLSSSSVSLI